MPDLHLTTGGRAVLDVRQAAKVRHLQRGPLEPLGVAHHDLLRLRQHPQDVSRPRPRDPEPASLPDGHPVDPGAPPPVAAPRPPPRPPTASPCPGRAPRLGARRPPRGPRPGRSTAPGYRARPSWACRVRGRRLGRPPWSRSPAGNARLSGRRAPWRTGSSSGPSTHLPRDAARRPRCARSVLAIHAAPRACALARSGPNFTCSLQRAHGFGVLPAAYSRAKSSMTDAVKTRPLVDRVMRDPEKLAGPLSQVDLRRGAAGTPRPLRGWSRVIQAHRQADDLVPLIYEQRGRGGGVDPTGHGADHPHAPPPSPRARAVTSANARPSASTSATRLSLPREIRTTDRPRASSRPMARMVAEACATPALHADPVDTQFPQGPGPSPACRHHSREAGAHRVAHPVSGAPRISPPAASTTSTTRARRLTT